jgi:hypothetical protein
MTTDSDGYDDDTIFLEETFPDHFDNKADIIPEGQVAKRRRLDPSLEAKLQRDQFWSVNELHIQETEHAFLSNAVFHINFFLDSSKKVNEGFALFVGGGIATPGFDPLPTTLDIEQIASWTEVELKDAVTKENHNKWGASVTAKWLKLATVGSFVILRHEYPGCPFCPKRLINADGKYIGPVYVIGVITKKVMPWSEEERDIVENEMGDFSRSRWPIHTVCRVKWMKMGLKKHWRSRQRITSRASASLRFGNYAMIRIWCLPVARHRRAFVAIYGQMQKSTFLLMNFKTNLTTQSQSEEHGFQNWRDR